ncbi:protein-tyrosine phosphatase family protein, partial [Salmonella sp. s51228]|uniref:protein-tyrosine phosphatase family protein n=1 Tax=Salmonella sp. s51228 TaxID=3159652 RepID=UPI00397EED19
INAPIYSVPNKGNSLKLKEISEPNYATVNSMQMDSKFDVGTVNNVGQTRGGAENLAVDDNVYYTFNNPVSISNQDIPIPYTEYKLRLDTLWKNECSELTTEYESLGLKSWRSTCDAAKLKENYKKNRFKDIYPYDHSRVILQNGSPDVGSDYINASLIPGAYVSDR